MENMAFLAPCFHHAVLAFNAIRVGIPNPMSQLKAACHVPCVA
uniref:Uncharacterized protein n=1 Tax=Curvibacter symbiont subsp. Hydra magnipapillata TaxID=667019 RepID=C9YDB7_CURXX|nr:hypothetical protein Csp_C26960 [Curvibacter putative symbiont of Hydra magnipapillata]